jgi:hypothetical protein
MKSLFRRPVVAMLIMLIVLALRPPASWAQTTTGGTVIDLSPVVQWLLGLLSAAGTVVAGMVTTWLYAKLGIAKTSAAAAAIQTAEGKAGAIAYSFLASKGAAITDVTVKNQAIAAGANYIMAEVPKALETMGISQASVLTRAEAALGKLLAADPTVSVGTLPALAASSATLLSGAPALVQDIASSPAPKASPPAS